MTLAKAVDETPLEPRRPTPTVSPQSSASRTYWSATRSAGRSMASSSSSPSKAVALVGATGLVGSNILKTLLTHPSMSSVSAFSRRTLDVNDPQSRLHTIVDSNSDSWASKFPASGSGSTDKPVVPEIFYSALGTTRAQAGSFEKQRKIDFDLNVALAKAAKEAGVRVYVLLSSAGVNSQSYMPYSKMKGELEEAISEIGFEKTIFVKPGLIVGKRNDTRIAEAGLRALAQGMGKISGDRLKDFWAQDADVIGRAAVSAGILASEGKAPEGKVWYVYQNDVVRLGRTQWRGDAS